MILIQVHKWHLFLVMMKVQILTKIQMQILKHQKQQTHLQSELLKVVVLDHMQLIIYSKDSGIDHNKLLI
ncbi:MAG: hypothetical protein CMG85_19435 [Marinobacter sp.]|nr:hypothetical protein [Marinobacter sp.]